MEVVGPGASGTCQVSNTYYHHQVLLSITYHRVQVADLPESRHGHSAVRLGESVVVCGGLSGRHIHERWIDSCSECVVDIQTSVKCWGWSHVTNTRAASLGNLGRCVHQFVTRDT